MPACAVRLLLPEGMSGTAAVAALGERLEIAPDGARTVDRTFWDTFDGRLHDAGLALVSAGGRLTLADDRACAEQVGAEHRADGTRPMLVADLPSGALRDRLEELVEMRAVTPIARLRSRLHALRVLDEDAKTVVRLTVEEPAVPGARRARCVPASPSGRCAATTSRSSACGRSSPASWGSWRRRARSTTRPWRRRAASRAGRPPSLALR